VDFRCLAGESVGAMAVSLEVEDTGFGIAEDELEQVFERCHQVEWIRIAEPAWGLPSSGTPSPRQTAVSPSEASSAKAPALQ
jgi:hypothetical protein